MEHITGIIRVTFPLYIYTIHPIEKLLVSYKNHYYFDLTNIQKYKRIIIYQHNYCLKLPIFLKIIIFTLLTFLSPIESGSGNTMGFFIYHSLNQVFKNPVSLLFSREIDCRRNFHPYVG